jgi:D-sedoheptulose 7-phosphate isomerase
MDLYRLEDELDYVFEMQHQLLNATGNTTRQEIINIVVTLVEAFKSGNKLLIFGNGGSAADAQHIAAEFMVAFKNRNRAPLPAIALTTDTSFITACSNDFDFNCIFDRQLEALMRSGDVVWGISTSGNSLNVINALKYAQRKLFVKTIGFTGGDGGEMIPFCNHSIIIPTKDTARIQEMHIFIAHMICELVENELFPK